MSGKDDVHNGTQREFMLRLDPGVGYLEGVSCRVRRLAYRMNAKTSNNPLNQPWLGFEGFRGTAAGAADAYLQPDAGSKPRLVAVWRVATNWAQLPNSFYFPRPSGRRDASMSMIQIIATVS